MQNSDPGSECAGLTNGYFRAIREGDAAELSRILADDFLLIEPLWGWKVTRVTLLRDIEKGTLKFANLNHSGMHVRSYRDTVIITGRTEAAGNLGPFSPFDVTCRYTHVHIRKPAGWVMVAAQETLIDSPEPLNDEPVAKPAPDVVAWMMERRRATGRTPSLEEVLGSGCVGRVLTRVLTYGSQRHRIWQKLDEEVQSRIAEQQSGGTVRRGSLDD